MMGAKVTSAMPYSVYAPKERNIPVLLQNTKSVHIQGRPMYAPRAYRVHVLRPPYKKGPSREKQKVQELHYLNVYILAGQGSIGLVGLAQINFQ